MPFRYRRSISLAPGLKLNIGKHGDSTSVGGREGHVTVGHGHTRTTVGVPGTGLSYTTTTRRRSSQGPSRDLGDHAALAKVGPASAIRSKRCPNPAPSVPL